MTVDKNYRTTQALDGGKHKVRVVTDGILGSELAMTNDIKYKININVYNQNIGDDKCV